MSMRSRASSATRVAEAEPRDHDPRVGGSSPSSDIANPSHEYGRTACQSHPMQPTWIVKLGVTRDELRAVDRPLTRDPMRTGIRILSIGSDEESPTVTFEFPADDARHARLEAQHRLAKAMRAGGVIPRQATVVWVAPVSEEGINDLRFLEQARELLHEQRWELAVVAAQIHLELQVATLVRRATGSTSASPLGRLVARQRRWAPHTEPARSLIEAVFDCDVTDFSGWEEYRKGHLQRRNDIVHRGQSVDEDSACASVDLIEEFWLWLLDAAGAHDPHLRT